MPRCLPLALIVITLVFAGCGGDPYVVVPRTTATVDGDPRQPPEERRGARPAPDRDVVAAAPTPEAALERYAELSINWTAETLPARQRQLARRSIDGARQTALLAAARVERDDTLRRSNVSSTGSVVSIAPGAGAARGSWVIVTREETVGDDTYRGLPPTLHVTFAKLEQLDAGWVVSSWAPQS